MKNIISIRKSIEDINNEGLLRCLNNFSSKHLIALNIFKYQNKYFSYIKFVKNNIMAL